MRSRCQGECETDVKTNAKPMSKRFEADAKPTRSRREANVKPMRGPADARYPRVDTSHAQRNTPIVSKVQLPGKNTTNFS